MASVTYAVGSNWGSGFIGTVTVPGGDQGLNGWTVEFDATFDIINIWGGQILSHVGNHYVVGNADYDANVAAGGQTSFGFQANTGSGGTTATGFILNGETPPALPTLSIADTSIKEANGGTSQLTFAVSLSQASTSAVTVHYATADGSAKAGSDYGAVSGTLTFAAGQTSRTISVPILGDTTIESNEGFTLNLSSPSGATLARATATGTILNDDPAASRPTLSVADALVLEGNSGTQDLAFTVTLSAASATPVTVAYATANGTATAGSDYTAASGTLTFAAGQTSQVVHVKVAGDTTREYNETLTLALSSPSGVTIADGTATGTILNDDARPTLNIGNASFAEGSASAPGHGTFIVSLSQASGLTVHIQYTTADGTAVAGTDYVAQAGTLTFKPGETQKTVQVTAIGDGVADPDKTFSVTLSSPSGAAVSQATGSGTILNDDSKPPPLPSLSIGNTTVTEGGAGETGWFSTRGNQIVDGAGNPVEIAGVNWFGFESSTLAPHGLWARGYKDMMNQMVQLGFNTIRLPFSSEMLHSTAAPNGIDFSKNPDLQGLSALQILDKIVGYAGQIGLRIILDHHRSEAGAGTSDNGLWYDSQYSQAQWVSDWQMLAQRYANNPTVIGADLHNEPYNGTWGDGGTNDWMKAAELAGNAIGTVNPNWLIFVEGIGTYQGQSYWWGGNLMGVKDHPVQLNIANKLVYSAHDYPNSVYPQPWFSDPSYPANLPAKFTQMWGYIYQQNIAPVWVGEFGTKLVDPKDASWLKALAAYLGGDFNNDGKSDIAADQKGISWTYWSWNPNSGDTGGILADDWQTVNQAKVTYLQPIESPFTRGGSNAALFAVTLSQPATQTITVDFHTVAGTATTADFTPVSGTLTFAPGEQSKTIAVPIIPDTVSEPSEQFTVVLTNAHGGTIATATGTATIIDSAAPPSGTSSTFFSPYIDMAMPVDADLTAISRASGIENFTLAFMLSSPQGIGWQGQGAITDDTLVNGTTILSQVQAVQAAGGNVTISFGGAAGQEAALTAPNAGVLQAEYQSVIDRYHISSIDFDIEGAAEQDQASLAMRDKAIVGLEAANPGLKVSFTLPVLPTGLDASGLAVLQAAKRDGVRIDLVNMMTMDYGSDVDNNGQMGFDAIQAAQATERQLDSLGMTNTKIGITPMIGVNDISSEVFTLADANALLNFAKSDPRVSELSMWSVARDNGNSAGAHFASSDSSGIAQSAYQFSRIFHQFDHG
jgi:chitinase